MKTRETDQYFHSIHSSHYKIPKTKREDKYLERLFDLFVKSEELMAELADSRVNPDAELELDKLLAYQIKLLKDAANAPSFSISDILIKLSLWRRFAPDLECDTQEMQLSDAVAYSAYIDLIKINEDIVATKADGQLQQAASKK